MPSIRPAGPYPIADATMPTWIIRLDESGVCASPGTRDALLAHLQGANYSDVLLFSHGWNTDFADALGQYGRFLQAFAAVVAQFPIAEFRPIFVGVTWPSVWIADDPGPVLESVEAARTAEPELIQQIARSLDPVARCRFYALTDAGRLTRDDALELAQIMAPALNSYFEESEAGTAAVPTPDEMVQLAARISSLESPGSLGEPVDVIGADGSPVAQASGLTEALDPRAFLRLFSLYQMKDRAGTVGFNGVSGLLRSILGATPAKVRVLGHSFGAKVMLSALCAPAPLPRKVDSMLLLQPAVSHLAIATEVPGRQGPGGYRQSVERVASPILTTFSQMDVPLHDVFHLALRRDADLGEARISAAGEPPNQYAALGGYGPRHSGERLISPIPAPGTAYPELTGPGLFGLDGSDQIIHSHGDVANAHTAWALRSQIAGSA